MSFSVNDRTNRISLTRGDTFKAKVSITDSEGAAYTPNEGDKIRFAMKKDYDDEEPLLLINIPIDSMILVITPEDTKTLEFGKYVYDVELTKANGDVDTFITKARIDLTEEVE